jgi:hypothetical protein
MKVINFAFSSDSDDLDYPKLVYNYIKKKQYRSIQDVKEISNFMFTVLNDEDKTYYQTPVYEHIQTLKNIKKDLKIYSPKQFIEQEGKI